MRAAMRAAMQGREQADFLFLHPESLQRIALFASVSRRSRFKRIKRVLTSKVDQSKRNFFGASAHLNMRVGRSVGPSAGNHFLPYVSLSLKHEEDHEYHPPPSSPQYHPPLLPPLASPPRATTTTKDASLQRVVPT